MALLAELLATEGVREEVAIRGQVGVMALHGGLEIATSSAARRCAELSGASLYTVEQPSDFRWHVPSTAFDPRESPGLERFLSHVLVAVSFHGFGRRRLEDSVLVGGRNTRLRRRIAYALDALTSLRVVTADDEIPAGLRGTHPANPVNLPSHGGVQLELSPQARRPEPLDELVRAVASVLRAEQSSVCPA